jgi:hypothetical protein
MEDTVLNKLKRDAVAAAVWLTKQKKGSPEWKIANEGYMRLQHEINTEHQRRDHLK